MNSREAQVFEEDKKRREAAIKMLDGWIKEAENATPEERAAEAASLRSVLEAIDGRRTESETRVKYSDLERGIGKPILGLGDPAQEGRSEVEAMRSALTWIAAQECYTFAECSLAEEIIGRARAAIGEPARPATVATCKECGRIEGRHFGGCSQYGKTEPTSYAPSAAALIPDAELLLDNAATASQVRELLRDDEGQETVLREAVRRGVYEPLAKLLRGQSADDIIEWIAGQTKVQHCTPAWCLTDQQIRALKGSFVLSSGAATEVETVRELVDAVRNSLTHFYQAMQHASYGEGNAARHSYERLKKAVDPVYVAFHPTSPRSATADTDYKSKWVMRHADGEEWTTDDVYTRAEIYGAGWRATPVRRADRTVRP